VKAFLEPVKQGLLLASGKTWRLYARPQTLEQIFQARFQQAQPEVERHRSKDLLHRF
jgi:hypothetical protein